MKTSFVSTPAFANALRSSMRQSQADLFVATKELASGRYADVGLELGNRTGLTVTLRQQFEQLGAIGQTNGLVGARLDASQVALTGLLDSADTYLSDLISARDSGDGPEVIERQARQGLRGMIDGLNATLAGQNLFAGINVDTQPLDDYFAAAPPASKAAIDAAFLAEFGFDQTDPNVSTITPAQMQAFLDGAYAAEFDAAAWAANWSQASDTTVQSRISASQTVESSASANEAPFRELAEAYVMLGDLATTGLNTATYTTVIDRAVEKIGEAIAGLTAVKARLGTTQGRLAEANERMSLQSDILETRIASLENIDPFEVATEVSALTTQVETSFALTARMQRLGILQYL